MHPLSCECVNTNSYWISPQIAKKTPVSSAAPIKFIITKTVNSKGLSPQTSVSPVIAGTSICISVVSLLFTADIFVGYVETTQFLKCFKLSFRFNEATFSEILCCVFIGRVLTQNSPGMPPRTINLSESHNTTIQSIPGKKIAISPLKTPSKVNPTHCSSFTKQGIIIMSVKSFPLF